MSDPIGYDGRSIDESGERKFIAKSLGESPPSAEPSHGDVVVTKDDRVQATLSQREQSMEDLATQLTHELNEADKRIRATIRNFMTSKGKPSKAQIGKGFERFLALLEAMNKSDTVIRNYLYNCVLGTQLQLRALRRVLDGRLGVPITDEELKAARESILSEDQKASVRKKTEKDQGELKKAVQEAQADAAKSG